MTAEQFENAMTPKTKMIIINSPGNPTGSVYTREELRAISEVAAEEEIYHSLGRDLREAHLRRRRARQHRLAHAGGSRFDHHRERLQQGLRDDRLASGLSRGAGGHRQGHRLDAKPQHVEPMFLCAKGRAGCAQGRSAVRHRHARRVRYSPRIHVRPAQQHFRPERGAARWGPFTFSSTSSSYGLKSQNFADRLLSKANVAVVPGIAFGDDRTIRLSYATSLDVIKKGLDRLEEFCKTL